MNEAVSKFTTQPLLLFNPDGKGAVRMVPMRHYAILIYSGIF